VVGRVVCAAAQAREETRGCHARSDFPDPVPTLRVRFVVTS
jgi:aspartate oxidase